MLVLHSRAKGATLQFFLEFGPRGAICKEVDALVCVEKCALEPLQGVFEGCNACFEVRDALLEHGDVFF